MHILACMKQVPQQNSVKINADMSINADGIDQIMNLFDEYAVEEAIAWNEKLGGKTTILSLGPTEWQEQLRRALAMGATDALLLNDPAFAQLDTLGAARTIAAAVKKLGDVNLIFTGRNSTDDENGALAPMLARLLGWTQLTYVGKVVSVDAKSITVERHLEDSVEVVEAPLPCVVSVVKGVNEPRYPSLLRIKKVAKVEIPTMSAADLGLDAAALAPKAQLATRVPTPPRAKGEVITTGDSAEKVKQLVGKLREAQVI